MNFLKKHEEIDSIMQVPDSFYINYLIGFNNFIAVFILTLNSYYF